MLKLEEDDFLEPVNINWKKTPRLKAIPGSKPFWRIEAFYMGQIVTFDAIYDHDEMIKKMNSLPKDLPNHTDWTVTLFEPMFAMYDGTPKNA